MTPRARSRSLSGLGAPADGGRRLEQQTLVSAVMNQIHESPDGALGCLVVRNFRRHQLRTAIGDCGRASMITGDFLAMSSTTDNVRPAPMPNSWRIDSLTIVGIAIGLFDLAFCAVSLTIGAWVLKLDIDTLRTMTLVTLALNGQAVFYVVRERKRLWPSRPSLIVMASTVLDFLIIGTLASEGILMAPCRSRLSPASLLRQFFWLW